MAKNLLIVESPAKSKTISKFLGSDFNVLSSFGHIRDLKTKGMGVDVDNHFAPEYEVSEDKKSIVKELRAEAQKAETVWLASDEDREGEAIAWHLAEVLDLDVSNTNRIVFHEITPKAINAALENPRTIDMKMVDAQQARRVLDRIVGFELSPVLWTKVRPSLSAGRVQSVAVRILVEREREINAFEAESSYRIRATFVTSSGEQFEADVDRRPKTLDEAKEILSSLVGATYKVQDIEVKPTKRHPAAPFTTSTLQQEASRRLGLSVTQTMRIAQSLYEAGHITYMRTDSVNLSSFAIGATIEEVEKEYGKKYVKARNFKTSTKGAQEAHEAIRPTHVEKIVAGTTKQEKAIYDLIRKRTMASQMADAELERTQLDIVSSTGLKFVARGEVITFDGFLKVYLEGNDDESTESDVMLLPKVTKGEAVEADKVLATERFTQRPPRYTEAALVKKMEELGIGRPSTYAPTIQTIQKRGYVERKTIEGVQRTYNEILLSNNEIKTSEKSEIYGADRQKLVPTDVGIVVNDFLVEYFPKVLEYNFTARVEKEFDSIAEGKKQWNDVIKDFYDIFHDNVESVKSERMDRRVGEREIGTDPSTGQPVFAKIGRFGPMVQIGESSTDGDKPRFASIPSSLSLETITLEEALVLFTLPRSLGEYKGETLEANTGRFGPYVRFGKLFASIPKDMNPYEITLDQAITLVDAKIEAENNKFIASFGEDKELIQVLNGRFGPYISYKKKNFKIPKGTDPQTLDEATCRKLIEESSKDTKDKKESGRKTKTTKKTTKSTAKKA